MATKKKTTKRAAKKTVKTAAKKSAKKTAKKAAGGRVKGDLRVRMYRVGFGDFFLLTVPTRTGPQHILIDCGVHAGDIKSMADCVQDLAKETKRKLALVIATHYHADHLSGFASNFDEFAQFEVSKVWITNRLDPDNKKAAKFKGQLTKLSNQLQLQLGARDANDDRVARAKFKIEDAIGVMGATAKEGGNEKALRLLTSGWKNFDKKNVKYYQAGEKPELPPELKDALTARLLSPAPIDSDGEFATSDNKTEQYLSAAADEDEIGNGSLLPFEKEWPATAANYPREAFREYLTREQWEQKDTGGPLALEQALLDSQPDTLLALADAVDGTLNNQSLVILFECSGKKLLFVGDAQWGNWSYWLYGEKTSGKDPGILKEASDILGSIDFYKVGHHGSTNANPIPAVAALSSKCVSMCSTESNDAYSTKRPYGTISKDPHKKGTEVPRIALMEEMETHTGDRLVRSDWIPVLDVKASPEAKGQLKKLPPNFVKGPLYIDYVFPK